MYLPDQATKVHSGNHSCKSDVVDSVPKESEVITQIIQKITNRSNSPNEGEIYQKSQLLEIPISSANLSRGFNKYYGEINNSILYATLLNLNIQLGREEDRSG